jgi:hypothetical protein
LTLPDSGREDVTYPFFPVGTGKFVALSICSFGLYELYWCYKNWQRIRDRSGESISPFWRAAFAPIWCFRLFETIQVQSRVHSLRGGGKPASRSWSGDGLATLYLILSIVPSLPMIPDPWWLISIFTFLAFLPVLGTTQEVNESVLSIENQNTKLTRLNLVVLLAGGLLVLFGVIGMFLPETQNPIPASSDVLAGLPFTAK